VGHSLGDCAHNFHAEMGMTFQVHGSPVLPLKSTGLVPRRGLRHGGSAFWTEGTVYLLILYSFLKKKKRKKKKLSPEL
jgi:hypothetical protein